MSQLTDPVQLIINYDGHNVFMFSTSKPFVLSHNNVMYYIDSLDSPILPGGLGEYIKKRLRDTCTNGQLL